jgi:hypothetical protein
VDLNHDERGLDAINKLRRKLQLLALQHLRDVQVEEVAVEDRLHDSGHDSDDIIESFK